MRLVLHTAAYWLMLELRDAIPKTNPLAVAEFVTLREKLLKIGARIVETASRIKLALATACPQAGLFRILAGALQPAGRERRGRDSLRAPEQPHPTQRVQSADRPSERTHCGIASGINGANKISNARRWRE